MPSKLTTDLLDVLDTLAGGVHAGFRPAHAHGVMYSGMFAPTPEAATLTRAPHAVRESTPVTVRFSVSAGVPTIAENDAKGSSPQGMAIRFHLADHVHTDIVAHSHNGFAARTGEEFLEFLRAVAASGPGSPEPPPIAAFLASHPAAKAFAEAPKPIPKSYASQKYFAMTAFQFTNAGGQSQFGRFQIRPHAAIEVLTAEEAAKKPTDFLSAEFSQRLAQSPVKFDVMVQLAEPTDDVTDATKVWPESRKQLKLGTVTITARVDELAPEQRKVIFDPVPRVDGIDSAGDPLTAVRSEIYLLSGRRRRTSGKIE
ncbi:catalase family peroxidase [Schlesneria paludicola]|uniref:catalase family peroxidase n=1 Tax=Schlesneria paludicola TaxID=360056 RepID=UPI00029A7BC2|nr:catalase family peroxidase [Schlesneria paludicola]